MKNPGKLVMVFVLAAFWLASGNGILVLTAQADETRSQVRPLVFEPVQYAKSEPVVRPVTRDFGQFVPTITAAAPVAKPQALPQSQSAYPTKLTLAQPARKAKGASVISETAFVQGVSDAITVFGDRIVPSPEVSGLEHFERAGGRAASDRFQWNFLEVSSYGKKYGWWTYVFEWRYPTEGQCPRPERAGSIMTGLAFSIPLDRLAPIGRLFTSR